MEQRKPVIKWHSVGLKVGQGSYVQLTVEVYKEGVSLQSFIHKNFMRILYKSITN